jgi:hypothetical protein
MEDEELFDIDLNKEDEVMMSDALIEKSRMLQLEYDQ